MDQYDNAFWFALDKLVSEANIVIYRPKWQGMKTSGLSAITKNGPHMKSPEATGKYTKI